MKIKMLLVSVAVWCLAAAASNAESPELDAVQWQEGPSVGDLGGIAEIKVPAGYVFAGANDTQVLMEAMENPVSGAELGLIAPAESDWFVVFEFDGIGYVPDGEKDSLDADAMLESIKQGTEAGNVERRRRGWSTMTILGWEQTPRYNEITHNLEWTIRAESEGYPVINHNTRLLGRGGVMAVTLVDSPETLAGTLPEFQRVIGGFTFSKGHTYAEFKKGDKMAQYGLSALVVGGASAVAVKTGAAKWLWKVIVVGFLGIAAFFKKLFFGKTE